MKPVPRRVAVATVLRSLLIQASWNTRTMIGHGVAFALKPALWWCHSDDEARRQALSRHVEHFNAHPYLSSMGLGAIVRQEVDGHDPSRIRRFKTAVRGPLGAIGDRLVWVGWLPAVALSAVLAALLGVRPLWVVLGFLTVYNAGHLLLRGWGWSAGYRNGEDVARAIREAHLQRWAGLLSRLAALLMGVTMGFLITEGVGHSLVWIPAGGLLFLVGNRARRRGWRPTFSVTAVVIGVIAIAATATGWTP